MIPWCHDDQQQKRNNNYKRYFLMENIYIDKCTFYIHHTLRTNDNHKQQ